MEWEEEEEEVEGDGKKLEEDGGVGEDDDLGDSRSSSSARLSAVVKRAGSSDEDFEDLIESVSPSSVKASESRRLAKGSSVPLGLGTVVVDEYIEPVAMVSVMLGILGRGIRAMGG